MGRAAVFPVRHDHGATGSAMSAYAIGGWIERSAVFVFNTWFLISLGRAFWFAIHGDRKRRRDWTARAVVFY